MQMNKLNKTLMAAFLIVVLASCSNSDAPAETEIQNVEASEENVENENKEEVVKTSDTKNEDKKYTEDKKENDKTVINVQNENKNESSENTDTTDATESENTNQTNEGTDDMTYEEREGTFISNLISSKGGERDEEFGWATINNMKIEDNTLIVEGSFDYRVNPGSEEAPEELEKNTYNFKFDENTKFQATGGMAEPQIFTAEEFIQYYQDITDSGLGLKIDVKDGMATIVSFAS